MNPETICFIPCRSASKGLERKNFRPFCGSDLTRRAITLALEMGLVVVAAPDDETIAEQLRREYDIHVFLRDPDLADGDHQLESWRLAHEYMETHYKMQFTHGVMLEPSSPCRTVQDVEQIIDWGRKRAAGGVSVNRKLHPRKLRIFNDGGRVINWVSFPCAHSFCQFNGIAYAATRDVIMNESLMDDIVGVIIDHPAVNIDDKNDFELAEAWCWHHERIKASQGSV